MTLFVARNLRITLVAAAAAVGLAASAALNAALPGPSLTPPVASGSAGASDEEGNTLTGGPTSDLPFHLFGFYDNSSIGGWENGSGGVTITGGLDPAVLVSASNTNGGEFQPEGEAHANGTLTYGFAVLGPQVVSLPVLLQTGGGISGTTGSSAGGSTELSIVRADTQETIFDSTTLSGPFQTTLTLLPNIEYDVTMTASVTVQGTGGASAAIDPMFTVDPSFIGAGSYSLEFSPGLLVPEPSTAAMLGLLAAATLAFPRQKRPRV